MDHLLLFFGMLLLPKVDTLRCYECAAGSSGSCIDATKECPWLADHCGALRLIVFHDNAVIAHIKGKSCTSAGHCANVSVNFGESRTLLTNKCCTTDLCNTLPAPVDVNGQRRTMKGCASKQMCSNNQHVSALIGAKVTCCDGDYCNSAGHAPRAGLLILLTPLLSLAMLS
ncbi:uncharacterized protein LOC133660661 isoform X2 [Entelurus aequoreus]|uniref:uncharacterized protein LOC133660661 isoform X2 n=1 Tax=Entelurus aequoreus TaxID=161455 RepID=UPI002B1DDF17|nr:uncharacterized protein LOC133660661 isoform X2 [Entelurus aequoreus]